MITVPYWKPDQGSFGWRDCEDCLCDQEHDDLKPDDTVFQAITGGNDLTAIGGKEMNSKGLREQVQFQRHRPAEEGKGTIGGCAIGHTLAIARNKAAICCCSMNPPTTLM